MNHLILIQLSQKARQITLKKHPFLSISQRRKTRPHADNLRQRCLNLYIWISNNLHLIHNLYSSHSSAKKKTLHSALQREVVELPSQESSTLYDFNEDLLTVTRLSPKFNTQIFSWNKIRYVQGMSNKRRSILDYSHKMSLQHSTRIKKTRKRARSRILFASTLTLPPLYQKHETKMILLHLRSWD